MPPVPRAKATPTTPNAAQKRVLASIKADRAKLETLEKKQKRLLADLQKTVKEMERTSKAQSDMSSKWSSTLDGIAQNLRG